MNEPSATARITRVAGMCDQWGVDFSAGCEHDCGYCHFHKYQALALRHETGGSRPARSLAVEDLLSLPEYPPVLYLSPFTDPLAPAARDGCERLLRRVLPLSVRVGISTKGVIPRRIFRLLADHPEQVLLFVGLTSLDERRNRSVEPGCPPARARSANFALAREHGLPYLFARFDPLLPGIDDSPEQLRFLVAEAARWGARQVSAAYLFLTPLANRVRLGRNPYLREALRHCTEACPIEGGTAFSVPLRRKQETYGLLHAECTRHGLAFGTCGCKDLRLTDVPFGTSCSFPYLGECAAASRKRPRAYELPMVPG